MVFWTVERQTQIAEMLGAGATFKDIGAFFGTTRNAIAGVINRNDALRLLTRRPQGNRQTSTVAPRPDKPRKIAVKQPPPSPPVVTSKPSPQPPVMRRVGLLDLRRFECRWAVEEAPDVIGGQRFCGAGAENSYCAFHAAVAFTGRGKGW